LARRRIDVVRLPVPYFAFGDHQSYLGCVDHLDRAFVWAERHRIAVLRRYGNHPSLWGIEVLNEPISAEM
jgi:hypothetical protein